MAARDTLEYLIEARIMARCAEVDLEKHPADYRLPEATEIRMRARQTKTALENYVKNLASEPKC